jgi:hypothetical protein
MTDIDFSKSFPKMLKIEMEKAGLDKRISTQLKIIWF